MLVFFTKLDDVRDSDTEDEDFADGLLKEEKEELTVQLRQRLALPLDHKLSEKYFAGMPFYAKNTSLFLRRCKEAEASRRSNQ